MTLAGKRKQFGDISETTPSRFLDVLPMEDVEREGFGELSPEKNFAKGEETLASLMNLFDSKLPQQSSGGLMLR